VSGAADVEERLHRQYGIKIAGLSRCVTIGSQPRTRMATPFQVFLAAPHGAVVQHHALFSKAEISTCSQRAVNQPR
jgi:hypothetical protein